MVLFQTIGAVAGIVVGNIGVGIMIGALEQLISFFFYEISEKIY